MISFPLLRKSRLTAQSKFHISQKQIIYNSARKQVILSLTAGKINLQLQGTTISFAGVLPYRTLAIRYRCTKFVTYAFVSVLQDGLRELCKGICLSQISEMFVDFLGRLNVQVEHQSKHCFCTRHSGMSSPYHTSSLEKMTADSSILSGNAD